MKAGTRLKSVVCDTEVMVVKAAIDGDANCGGAPMVLERPTERAAIDPSFAAGTQIGKRYVDATGGIELLCLKGGQGSLSFGGAALLVKDAKPLPSSD
jgi:hypothetical protein